MSNIKTTLHCYRFDIRTPEGKAGYEALKAKLAAVLPRRMVSHGGKPHYLVLPKYNSMPIELETKFLFDNQWNTAPVEGVSEQGLRVFDWAQDTEWTTGGAHIKQGHYLDQTPDMAEVRRNTHKCGYCGAHEPAQKGYVFCPHCLDSEYLKESDLKLTRMRPIDESGPRGEFKPLSDAERAYLLPLYKAAQLHGSTERGKARKAKQRLDIENKFKKETRSAKIEHDGLLWLLDHGLSIDNVIYYTHTGVFSFGWRSPVSADVRDGILEVISEFPFAYEIKCADGRKPEAA